MILAGRVTKVSKYAEHISLQGKNQISSSSICVRVATSSNALAWSSHMDVRTYFGEIL